MEIQYQLTQSDFQEAIFKHRSARVFTRWFYRFLAVVVIGMGSLTLLTAAVNHNQRTLVNLGPFGGLILMWAGILWLLPLWTARNQFRNQPAAQGMRTVFIDESGVHSRWNGGTNDVEWKNYIRHIESRNLFLIYTSPACFGMLPKRAFKPEEIEPLRRLLAEKIPDKR